MLFCFCISPIVISMPDRFKQIQRITFRTIRKNLSSAFQQKASNQICTRIRHLHEYRYAKKIGLYKAIQGEIDLTNLWLSAPLQGKFCYFPKLNSDRTLTFLPATPSSEFILNQYGIPEPAPTNDKPTEKLDVIFIPLVGFDQKGTRLGMGGGYYDRSLKNINCPLLIGVAFEFQRISYIEAREWDVPLHGIVTEKKSYWIKQND